MRIADISDRALAIVGVVVAVVFGIAGLAAAYYFYLEAAQERTPTFLVDPARAAIVSYDPNNISDLAVLYRGAPINKSNVTAIRLYFWNAGNLPIQRQDVLRRVSLSLPEGCLMLDARVIKESRDITGLKVSIDEKGKNVAYVDFDILEINDGGTIQIIFAGDPDASVTATGVIIGASVVLQTAYTEKDISSYRRTIINFKTRPVVTVLSLLAILTVPFNMAFLARSKSEPKTKIAVVVTITAAVMVFMGYIILFPTKYTPLFGVPPTIVEAVGN